MNTRNRIASTLVGIVTTCLLSAGAAVALPQQTSPDGPSIPASSPTERVFFPPSPTAQPQLTDAPTTEAEQLALQRAYTKRMMERAFAPQPQRQLTDAPTTEAEQLALQRAYTKRMMQRAFAPQLAPDPGNGSPNLVFGVTAVVGLVLGAAGIVVTRRLGNRSVGTPAAEAAPSPELITVP